ncbi:2112_t:CDS:2 [Entrophospora sp. SA101]|nr:2112_t:CDS:2 [Entrophospora sp. SA101]
MRKVGKGQHRNNTYYKYYQFTLPDQCIELNYPKVSIQKKEFKTIHSC